MANEAPESKPAIDVAIDACSSNIRRNLYAAFLEALVVLVLILIVGIALFAVAKVNQEDGSLKRREMMDTIQEIELRIARGTSALESSQAEHERLVKMFGKSPGPGFDAIVRQESEIESLKDTLKNRTAGLARLRKELEELSEKPSLSDMLVYGAAVLFVVLVGILSGLYRLHLREVNRNEQLRIGFHRIRIAANNSDKPGFATEVRIALTDGAFAGATEAPIGSKRIDSPLPGHPGSDVGTTILNKFLDQIDVVLKPKDKTP